MGMESIVKGNPDTRKRLKSLFILGEFPLTTETFIMDQITGLIDKGVDVKILSIRRSKEIVSDKFRQYGLEKKTTYLNIPRSKKVRIFGALKLTPQFLKNPVTLWKSLNFLKYKKAALSLIPLYIVSHFLKTGEKFDVLHCHFGQRGIYGAVLKEVGIPGKLITSFYGGDLSSFIEEAGKSIYKPLFEIGDFFLPLSKKFEKILLDLGCPPDKIKVLPLGIDLSKFKYIKRPKHEKITLLTVGRLVEKKGHRYAIEAIRKSVHLKKIEYLIAGDGPMRPELEKLTKKLGISANVEFLGVTNPDLIPKLYKKSDIFILPSHISSRGDTEGTPMVLMEAQATGLPIISTIHSSIPEVVLDKKTGFLVEEKDSEALAKKIDLFIENGALRERMGKLGRVFIRENYDKQILIKRLMEIYKS